MDFPNIKLKLWEILLNLYKIDLAKSVNGVTMKISHKNSSAKAKLYSVIMLYSTFNNIINILYKLQCLNLFVICKYC